MLRLQNHALVAHISVVRPVHLTFNGAVFALGDGNRAVGRGRGGGQVAVLHRQRDLGNGDIGLRHHPVAHQEHIGSAAQSQRLAVLIKLNGDPQLLHLRLVAIAIHRDSLKQEIVIVAAGGDGMIRTVERVRDLQPVACVPHRLRQGVPVEPELLFRTERVQRSAAVAARHVHLVRNIGRLTVDLHLDQTEGIGADVGIGRAAVGREGDALIVVEILGRQGDDVLLRDGVGHVFGLDVLLTVDQAGPLVGAKQSGPLREHCGKGKVFQGLLAAAEREILREEAAAEAAAADADGKRPPLRDGLAALFNDDTALELAAVDHGFRLAYPVRSGGVGEADQPLELAAVEFGLAVGRQQGGIDIGDADLRGDGVDLAAVKDDLRVALALDDHNAVFGKTVIDADPPAVEREASGLGVDQHLLAAARIGIGVDVELAAAAAVLDRQVALHADGSRERRGSAEKGHGIAVKIQLNRSGLLDGLGISRAVVESLGVNVGAELDIGCAGAQGGAELCIGGNDFRIAFGGAAAGGRGGAPQGGEEAEQHYQCKQ